MDRPRARPRNFFNTENGNRNVERDKDNNETPEKRPRRDRDRRTARENTIENDSDLDTAEYNRRIERIQRDLTRRDRELEDERIENEKALEKIKKLERDKVELKREVEDFRIEAEEYKRTIDEYKAQMRSRSESYSPGESDNEHSDRNGNGRGESYSRSSKKYELIISQKNKDISQLIDDLEKLDDDKANLKEKLAVLQDNLKDATQLIEKMANEHFDLKSKYEQFEDQIRMLEEEKTVLQIKERDLMGFKERHEQYLDNLSKAVDIRVDIWKKMMMQKDEEIGRLTSKVETLMSQIPNMQLDSERTTIRHLQKKLNEREDQISQLNDELSRATHEINSNINLIENLQSRINETEDADNTVRMVKSLQIKMKKLEDKLIRKEQQLKNVEKEAEAESSEHAALLARIHAYESGEYGLSEAISEIKDLKVQIRIRDKQVESVTQEINILQMQVQDLDDENEMLRDKLGLQRNVDVNNETKRYLKSRKNEVIALRSKVNHMDDKIVQLKTINFTLRKHIAQMELHQQNPLLESIHTGQHIPERDRPDGVSISSPNPASLSGKEHSSGGVLNFKPEDWKNKYEIVLEENTALRKGLQEILDAMHKLTDEGTSDVFIQSPVLEDLLREMSSRGIINYPFPISAFQLKVSNLEGKCSQLREDLHKSRQEEKNCRQELMDAKSLVMVLEEKLLRFEDQPTQIDEPDTKELTSQEIQTDLPTPTTEGDVSERILHEKEKLAGMMKELKLHIKELEDSRKRKDAINISNMENMNLTNLPTQTQVEFHNTLVVARDTVKLLEEKLLHVEKFIETTRENESEERTVQKSDMETQTEEQECDSEKLDAIYAEKELMEKESQLQLNDLRKCIHDLECNLKAKEELIHGFQIISHSYPERDHPSCVSDIQEALTVAKESIVSLQRRLQSKDNSIVQYQKLLVEVRTEMTNAADRHVQEMRQLQLTIHQQQKTYTRLKSTLSHPVKDTSTVEGTIKDQLARIHELEDELSQLLHTLANAAAQLTAARSDAHRWRCTAEMRLKEVEQARDHFSSASADEMHSLKRKLKDTQMKLEKAEDEMESNAAAQQKDSVSDLVSILKTELEEKDKQIGVYLKTLKTSTFNEKFQFESLLSMKEKDIKGLREEISKHLKTISNLQLKLSKMKAVQYKSGVSNELDELRLKLREVQDEKLKLENDIHEIHSKRDEEENKKITTAESIARWEESKKWKKNKEKLEAKVKKNEIDNEKMEKLITTLKASIHRLEKEKLILDTKLRSKSSFMGTSMSKSSIDLSEASISGRSYQEKFLVAQNEITHLREELQDLKELMEKTEFEGLEAIEKLNLEIKCLKERIVTQERQLTGYEVAQKGDKQVVYEMEKMANQGSEIQKEVNRLEEENLFLRLQIEQLQQEAPILRDRVKHLQNIMDALRSEKAFGHRPGSVKLFAQKPLQELERTIQALKQVTEKLQTENKRLKTKTDIGSICPRPAGFEQLRSSCSDLMDENRTLRDRVQSLNQEVGKFQHLYMEKCSVVDSFDGRLHDAENRAKSSEMKLKAFLGDEKSSMPSHVPSTSTSNQYAVLTHKVQKMEEDILHKSKILATAKQALKGAEQLCTNVVVSPLKP